MLIRGRTAALFMVLAMIASSLVTIVLTGGGDDLVSRTVQSFFGTAAQGQGESSAPPELPSDLHKLLQAYQIIKSSYLEKVEDRQLIDGAIQGMLDSLNDPYSVYMDPEETREFNSSLESTFEGIGAEVTMKNGKVTIVSPFKGSPAEKAGLKPNDQILSVNGESLEGLDLNEAVLKIRGPKGTKVKLEIERSGLPEPLEIVVVRDEIPIETVYADVIRSDGRKFGLLTISQFSLDTTKDFAQELKRLEGEGIEGLIIDVRGNPGGLLTSVVEIAQMLVPDHGTILQVEYSNGEKEVFTSKQEKERLPLAVLVDKGSASASEILAAALKASGYPVVGQPTFGKGTVQNTVELGDKSQIKLTIAKWLTPDGEWIHEKGVQPTIFVEQPDYFHVAPLPEGKVLRRDMNEIHVRNLQLILKGLGFTPGRTDGYFDARTETAVKAFQKMNGLPVTGIVDKKTAELLQEQIVERINDPRNDRQLKAAVEALKKEIEKRAR
ncbi:S41 family peptidase [Bacillaceae bacterium]